ncbi:MAG: proline--tRNA ligase [Candidatus Marinimicrobia bacterium]|nr:proline--tRNA ligase [Candidatus Neomarinimicrobiota bacterium]
MSKGITPKETDYSAWYNELILKSELADYAPVKGCMVIRPHGYAIWEKMRDALDIMFKATGHENAYFPMLIPESFIKKEAEHVKGFSPEFAVVTHGGGKELEEPLILRPTSETIIWSMYKDWIHSYRDLPLLINQWANIIRWEMRTRLFLRTTEFLWQEGHTAHATAEEAEEETLRMLNVYKTFTEEFMAMPVLTGKKSESQKFAGAVATYAIEAMMGDKKALQAGTSHYLGQNFAKAFDVKFQSEENKEEYVYATSWGVSTRLIGALVMTHSDNKGLVLPPKLSPFEVIIIPIWKSDEEETGVREFLTKIERALNSAGVTYKIDDRKNYTPGWKFNEWELKGIPLRIEVGPRDVKENQLVMVRRDLSEKVIKQVEGIGEESRKILDTIQKDLFEKAKTFRADNTKKISSYDDFKEFYKSGGGFAESRWCGSPECEQEVQEETKATIRVIPFEQPGGKGSCIKCGKESETLVVFAKSY